LYFLYEGGVDLLIDIMRLCREEEAGAFFIAHFVTAAHSILWNFGETGISYNNIGFKIYNIFPYLLTISTEGMVLVDCLIDLGLAMSCRSLEA